MTNRKDPLNPFASKVAGAVARDALYDGASKLLVCLSGGADSVSLLLVLKELYPASPLAACHVHHGIRGEEADRDEAFVKAFCEKQNVPLTVVRVDAPKAAETSGDSLELAARKLRYQAFADVCRQNGVSLAATAHTASDNAETVLFNLVRGTGLAGLCGIPARRPLADGISVVRPLLACTREDVLAYLAFKKQDYVTDSTNDDTDYSRNYLRREVLPRLASLNPSFEDAFSRAAKHLTDVRIFLDKTVQTKLTDDVRTLSFYDDAVAAAVIARLYTGATGLSAIEETHIRAIRASFARHLAYPHARPVEICLPGGFSAFVRSGKLSFAPTVRKKTPAAPYAVPLKEGVTPLPDTPYTVCVKYDAPFAALPQTLFPETAGLTLCDVALLSLPPDTPLTAENRKPGDSVRTGGFTRTVKWLFNHKKVPLADRDRLPLIKAGDEIVFVPGVCVCDAQKNAVTADGTVKILLFKKTRGDMPLVP